MGFICSICASFVASSLRQLVSHLSLQHSNEPNFSVMCGIQNCPRSFKKLASFKSHLSRDHRDVQHGYARHENLTIRCPYCSTHLTSLSVYVQHCKLHVEKGYEVDCPMGGCGKKYGIYSSLTSHISRSHCQATVSDVKSELLNSTLQDTSNQPVITSANFLEGQCEESDEEKGHGLPDNFCDQYTRNFALFLMKIQELYALPYSTVQSIVQDFEQLMELNSSSSSARALHILHQNGIDQTVCAEISECFGENVCKQSLSLLSTQWKRDKYYQEHFGYVSPKEIILGRNECHNLCTFQYVPLMASLRRMLQNDTVLSQVLNPRKQSCNILEDFRDGRLFHKNTLSSSDGQALQIVLYFDEFEIVNPLGPHKKKYKLCGFYYVLGNLHPANRSALPMIQLVALCRSRDLKYFGAEKILEPLISDLKLLETDGLDVPGVPTALRGSLAFVAGDNLGSHMIGGFLQSFSGKTTRICRFCMATAEGIQDPSLKFQPRTKENYEYHVKMSEADAGNVSVYGVKKDSSLNQLQYFHVTSGLPPDVMHDLLEGLAHLEVSLVLKKLQTQGHVDLQFLNQEIESWAYGPLDSRNRPVEIGAGFNIRQTSARMWCLIRLMPLFIGHKVPEDNAYWALLLLLKEIVEYAFAPKISKQLCVHLHTIVMEHNCLFKSLFHDVTLKPKHHYLTHYAEMMLDFGPLRNCWCMRFEAKHSYFKSLVVRIQNFINAPAMLAKRHERMQAYHFSSSPGTVCQDVDIRKSISTKTALLSQYIQQKLTAEGFVEGSIIQAEVVHCKGIAYHSGMYLIVGFKEDDPVFGKIEACFYQTRQLAFLVSKQCGLYHAHFGAYTLQAGDANTETDVVKYEDLCDHYPLSAYFVNGKVYIVLKHLVFNDSLYK